MKNGRAGLCAGRFIDTVDIELAGVTHFFKLLLTDYWAPLEIRLHIRRVPCWTSGRLSTSAAAAVVANISPVALIFTFSVVHQQCNPTQPRCQGRPLQVMSRRRLLRSMPSTERLGPSLNVQRQISPRLRARDSHPQ